MTTTTYIPMAKRVAAGAEWLDLQRPGWADELDDDVMVELNMGHPGRCVLGQLAQAVADNMHASFFDLVHVDSDEPRYDGLFIDECLAALHLSVRLDGDEATALGFDIDCSAEPDDEETYRGLEYQWVEQILKRRAR